MDLDKIKQAYKEISEKLADPAIISHWEEFQELSRRRAFLEKIVEKADELGQVKERIEENTQILAGQEEELASLAQEELNSLLSKKDLLERELHELSQEESSPSVFDPEGSDRRAGGPDAIIMEIRPGAGGEEASLFARNLYDMYKKYAEKQGWKYTVLDLNETEVGGMREVSIEFQGKEAYKKLKSEGGVHRVQRIPSTEKAGRIHTSTASVVVFPKARKAQVQLNPSELRIDVYNSSGPGGQNVNKRKTAVRVTHLPSGLVVASQASRNQQQNREFALTLLAAKLLQQKENMEGAKIAGARKDQIGTSERAEKIRTYNFPQDRMTDHRIKKSWHGIEKIMAGELDEITQALQESSSNV